MLDTCLFELSRLDLWILFDTFNGPCSSFLRPLENICWLMLTWAVFVSFLIVYWTKKQKAETPLSPDCWNALLQIIGNLIYYRYINSAIVAPDAFDVIDVGAAKGLTNDQRRNLGSIAKILQFAASNKGASCIHCYASCGDYYKPIASSVRWQ